MPFGGAWQVWTLQHMQCGFASGVTERTVRGLPPFPVGHGFTHSRVSGCKL